MAVRTSTLKEESGGLNRKGLIRAFGLAKITIHVNNIIFNSDFIDSYFYNLKWVNFQQSFEDFHNSRQRTGEPIHINDILIHVTGPEGANKAKASSAIPCAEGFPENEATDYLLNRYSTTNPKLVILACSVPTCSNSRYHNVQVIKERWCT